MVVLLGKSNPHLICLQTARMYHRTFPMPINARINLTSIRNDLSATFDQRILCAPGLLRASRGALPTSQDLEEICFENCRTSLEALRTSQIANCTTKDTIIGGDKILYPATYITDRLLYAYDWSCVKDS